MAKTLESLYNRALAERGVVEGPGELNNPRVVAYYRDAGFGGVKHDSVPWCAAFLGAMLKREGWKPSGSLMARSYLTYGKKILNPRRGCIAVLRRGKPPMGHVNFFVEWADIWQRSFWGLGGNQRNAVTIARFSMDNVLGFRIP